MYLRVSHPGKPIVLRDFGPAHAEPTSKLARLPIDEAIAETWRRGHPIRLVRGK